MSIIGPERSFMDPVTLVEVIVSYMVGVDPDDDAIVIEVERGDLSPDGAKVLARILSELLAEAVSPKGRRSIKQLRSQHF